MSHPSKRRGYDFEVRVLEKLSTVRPDLKRTGSVNYKKAAPDLYTEGKAAKAGAEPIRLVATGDERGPVLITGTLEDLQRFFEYGWPPVAVQCKKRKTTWVGRLWKELKEAT